MRFFNKTAQVIFILCVPLVLFSASIAIAINSGWFYRWGLAHYGVSQVTGIAPAELNKAADGLITYFNNNDEYINVSVIKDGQPFALFNEREQIHLKDVKGLIQFDYKMLLGTGLYALIFALAFLYFRRRRLLWTGALWGGGLTLILMLALGVGIVSGFNNLFIEFHILSFSNDFWQLNPATDYLVMMFPEEFWYWAFVYVTGLSAFFALVVGGTGWWRRMKIVRSCQQELSLKSVPQHRKVTPDNN